MTKSAPSHPSLLALEGGINFRDLGGLRTADGQRIRPHQLFRAGSLDQLSAADCEHLVGVPISHVVDYRDPDEVTAKPDILWEGANYHTCPANPIRQEITTSLESLGPEQLSAFNSQAFMLELYQRLPFNNPAYRQLVALLQRPEDGALVQHCAVGKDRTGIGSALVLFALGVDEKTVMEDYLITDITLAPFREQMLASLADKLNKKALSQFSFVLSAQEAFLATSLRTIKERYGSINRWLATDYGLDDDARYQLQRKYLAD
ncbi:MAG: tyrosine-protein phosphatase [Candidatus Malihini olakiniferum]